VQIEDIQGCQVSDFLAFHRARPGVGLSTTVTRALVTALPAAGPVLLRRRGQRTPRARRGHGRAARHVRDRCNRETYEALGFPTT
jgi:uncharacterized protein YcgI (DUF1989 family)